MALNMSSQVLKLIEDSKNILIIFPKEYNVDSISSALSFSLYLKSLNKNHDIVCQEIDFVENFNFLFGIDSIKNKLESSDKFVIKLNTTKAKVKELSYDMKDDFLNINIISEKGSFNSGDVLVGATNFKYDLIISVSTSDLESLGEIFTSNSEFFYSTPIINIDHSTENEHFGKVNIVDINSSATTEVVFNLLKDLNYDEKNFNENLSTLILAGIIFKTRSFKSDLVTPRCLQISSELIKLGAKKEIIIKNLYQRKSISVMKIWGKILSRISQAEVGVFYSSLNFDDFSGIKINASDIVDVIYDLLNSIHNAKIVLVSYQLRSDLVRHIVWADKNYDALFLLKAFLPKGSKSMAYIDIANGDLGVAEKNILDEIKARMVK